MVLANVRLLHRFLSGVATVIALTVVSAIMAGMLLSAAFVGNFILLVHLGLDPIAAGILVVVAVLAFLGVLIAMTVRRVEELRDLPNRYLNFDVPVLAKVTDFVESFIGGFIQHAARQAHNKVQSYATKNRRYK